MSRNVIIGSCGFSIPFEWSIITFFEVIIGCPGMFSEHLMPPRGVEHWLELLMQICINFFFRRKARHARGTCKNLVTFVSWDPSHERKNLIVKVISQVIEVNHPIEKSGWKKDYFMSRWQKQPKHKENATHTHVAKFIFPRGTEKRCWLGKFCRLYDRPLKYPMVFICEVERRFINKYYL